VSTAGRTVRTFSARSRRELRWDFAGRAWEALGERPAMLTLTYPAAWRPVCPDARTLVRQREALKQAWVRAWGAPVGSWHVEFQPRERRAVEERQAPHLHMYLGLPDDVSEDEFEVLRRRTTYRHWLERKHGKYKGRGKVPPLEGEFSEWLLGTWSRIVGSGDPRHAERGADITPAFWSDDVAARADRSAIADYFWRESGKFGQKTPPEDFGGLRYWGVWGERQGFVIVEGQAVVARDAWMRERRLYTRLVAESLRREAEKFGQKPRAFKGPRGLDGLTAFVKDAPTVARRAERWAEA
jgi:hypothetical protein